MLNCHDQSQESHERYSYFLEFQKKKNISHSQEQRTRTKQCQQTHHPARAQSHSTSARPKQPQRLSPTEASPRRRKLNKFIGSLRAISSGHPVKRLYDRQASLLKPRRRHPRLSLISARGLPQHVHTLTHARGHGCAHAKEHVGTYGVRHTHADAHLGVYIHTQGGTNATI